MSKPVIKNNRILRSQQVLNALIAVVHPYLPLDLQNTRPRTPASFAGASGRCLTESISSCG